MSELSVEQIRSFRLRSHHLDAEYQTKDIAHLVGACGMQNSPPGAWETALHARVPECSLAEMEHLLYEEKSLLQAWSLRGAPVIFPTAESDAFLSALLPKGDEPWIYTKGISLALEFLQMTFEESLELLGQVIPRLDDITIVSKNALDQTLAEWIAALLPPEKRTLWNHPSMYGNPDKQTVGGAVVSFLLRPCAFLGNVVFGERQGISPTFTSYRNWTGGFLTTRPDAGKMLVRKFLHCYGPATPDSFVSWLGCSGKQGHRLWDSVAVEMDSVLIQRKKTFFLDKDKESLFSPPSFQRELLLLGGHDPFLDQRDRSVLQPDQTLQRQIWKLVTNPGAVIRRGEITGIWNSKKKARGMEIKLTLWANFSPKEKKKLLSLAEEYAAFRQQKPLRIEIED